MNNSFVVYIDESGDEGFAFSRGSSDWFVIAAVVTKSNLDLQVVRLVDYVRDRLNKPPKKPLHFRDLKHEQRLPYIDAISKADLKIITVLVHKPSLIEREVFSHNKRLYFYAVRYLLERVSWYCRDHYRPKDTDDGSALVIFSNRSEMSYNRLREYLTHLQDRSGLFDVRVDWSVIKPEQVISLTHGKQMGLQIADAVASSYFYACQLNRYEFTEDRYARMLLPRVYHYNGAYRGYGLKIWPREAEKTLIENLHLNWLEKYDKKD